jgi:hypothetical protein
MLTRRQLLGGAAVGTAGALIEGLAMPLAAGPTPTAGLQVGMTVDPTEYATYGQFPGTKCSRIFSAPGSGLKSWTSSAIAGLPASVEPWISAKDYPSDAALVAWINAATRPARFSWWHERDNDGGDHAARMDFFAKQRHLADVFATVPGSKVRLMSPPQTLQWTAMASTSAKAKGAGDWRLWWPGSAEGASWDCYADSWRTTYPDPRTFLRLPFEAAEGTGRRLYVAELGAARLSSDRTGSGRAAWIRDVVAILRARGAAYVAWWNDLGTGGVDFRLTDKPSADAWREALNT